MPRNHTGWQREVWSLHPRASSPDPRAQSLEPRPSSPDPRAQTLEPRAQTLEPRPSSPDPRAQTLNPIRPQALDFGPLTSNPKQHQGLALNATFLPLCAASPSLHPNSHTNSHSNSHTNSHLNSHTNSHSPPTPPNHSITVPPSLPARPEGGLTKLLSRAANPWGNCYACGTILYFLLFDPTVRWGGCSRAAFQYPDPDPLIRSRSGMKGPDPDPDHRSTDQIQVCQDRSRARYLDPKPDR